MTTFLLGKVLLMRVSVDGIGFEPFVQESEEMTLRCSERIRFHVAIYEGTIAVVINVIHNILIFPLLLFTVQRECFHQDDSIDDEYGVGLRHQ